MIDDIIFINESMSDRNALMFLCASKVKKKKFIVCTIIPFSLSKQKNSFKIIVTLENQLGIMKWKIKYDQGNTKLCVLQKIRQWHQLLFWELWMNNFSFITLRATKKAQKSGILCVTEKITIRSRIMILATYTRFLQNTSNIVKLQGIAKINWFLALSPTKIICRKFY